MTKLNRSVYFTYYATGGIFIKKIEFKKPWEITCETAYELIEKSKGDINGLGKIDGFKLISHLKKCEVCENKWKQKIQGR